MMRSRSAWCLVLSAVSLHVGVASAAGDPPLVSVAASVETPALFDDEEGDDANADDPAIWVHPHTSEASLVVATKKNGGLSVYDLSGVELQSIRPPAAPTADDEPGRFNNVDILLGFSLAGRAVDLAVVTDRGRDQIRFYAIDPHAAEHRGAPLTDVTAVDAPLVFSFDQVEVNQQATAYGVAVRSADRGHPAAVFASRRHGAQVAKLLPFATRDGRVSYRRVDTLVVPHTFTLPNHTTWTPCTSSDDELPQVEGMVVDADRGVLYLAQEDVGIWEVALDRKIAVPRLVDKVREFGVPYDRTFDAEEDEFACTLRFDQDPGYGGKHLSADAEGLTIYDARGGKGYLLASSQGDSTYAVYDRGGDHRYLGGFRVAAASGIDSVEHSDGAAVVNVPLGPNFPHGLFVTQDGENTPVSLDDDGQPREGTNFKLVPWEDIAGTFARPLLIDTRANDSESDCR